MGRLPDRIARRLAPADHRTDGDLLAAFRAGGPAADADFAELVRRHGPLVWGVCRRTLPAAADAEDAFQAVFLVLVRRSGGLTAAPTVGPWLHRVAALTARSVRRRNARRSARTAPLPADLPAPGADPDLSLDLDAALLALPEKYRSPIVLCHLLGCTRSEAAARLGCPEGTLSAWLSRGLTRLRTRLGGHDPAKVLGLAAAAVPTGLAGSAVRAAGAARVAGALAAPSTVSLIAEGVLRMFWVKKATAAAAALSAVFALGMGVGMSARVAVPSADGQEKAAAVPPAAGDTAVRTAPVPNPGPDAQIEKDIEAMRARVRAADQRFVAARMNADAMKEKIDLYWKRYLHPGEDRGREEGKPPTTAEVITDLTALKRFEEEAAQARDERAQLQRAFEDLLTKLHSARARPAGPKLQPVPPAADTTAELDASIEKLKTELAGLAADRIRLAASRAALDAEARRVEGRALEVEAAQQRLMTVREERAKQNAGAKADGGFVLLTVTGDAKAFEFTLSETGADGKVVGTATVKGADLLQKLLARTRNDPAAPKELRVVAAPPTAFGVGPATALKACDAAGYQKVTFTGYVIAGGFARGLKPDEKGEVPGFNRYDGVERAPASLVKEIELGRRTY